MFFVARQNKVIYKLSTYFDTRIVRTGYIVLVPEIGEESHSTNNILKPNGLPAFNDITIEHCLGAVGQQATAVEKCLKDIEKSITQTDGKYNITKMFRELDEAAGPLETTWGIAKSLYLGNSTLIPTKSYMNIHERARTARFCKYTSKTLYNYLAKQSFDIAPDSDIERLRQKYVLEGKLNGLELPANRLDDLNAVLSQLTKERTSFKNKVNTAVNAFTHIVSDYNIMREFPPSLLEATAKDPMLPMQSPWKITLHPQIIDGFLKYCPDRMQRWNVWQANIRKCSTQLEKATENSTHIEKIRALRKRQANILGYETFASMSMETKMVGSVDKIKEILYSLLQFAGPAQLVEMEKLQKFAEDNGFKHKLDLFDVTFWERKYLISTHNANEESLREFFPLPKVMTGLFKFAEKLFNIKIVERHDVEVWQPAVKYFDVYDCDITSLPSLVGGFYLDFYSKENKFGRNNGWMVSIRNRNEAGGNKPLCALIFNFTPPSCGKPYLLNIKDLRMVFKTFGSTLQHLLTKADFSDLAGLSNIEWDASQVTGQVMCNFLEELDSLKSISSHYATNEPIPDALAANITLFKTNLAGYNLCQELYLANLDLELYQSKDFWLDVVKKLWPMYRFMPLDKKDAHPCSMTEIFAGDWAAAYFSNLYSKIIAADISAAFQQETNQQDIGKRFKETFLSAGGSLPAMEVFRRFRGRDPSVEALLKSLKLVNTSPKIVNL